MSKVKYFYDLLSQPSRALWIALRMTNTPYEDCPVALRKLEHMSEEYKKVNRFQKVPAIVDGDFHLSESIAILRYLADKGHFNDNLYPKELRNRTRVDEFLEWQHLTVRRTCELYTRCLWILPINGLAPMPPEKKIEELRSEMETNLKILEDIWLEKSNFVAGNKLTIGDIFGACEVMQTRLTKYDVAEKFPKIAAWVETVRQATNPHFDEAHKYVNKKSKEASKL